MNLPLVTEIKLLQKQRTLSVKFSDGKEFTFTCEFLRKNSPSAEVKGHGGHKPSPPKVDPKINIIQIEPVGNYAVKLYFDDGHQDGIYSWQYFYELGKQIQ